MTLQDDPRFDEAYNRGLKPHGHGSPETLWIEDRWGACHPIEEMGAVLEAHDFTDSLDPGK